MNKIVIGLICICFFSCSKTEIVINGNGQHKFRRMNLVVKNTDIAAKNSVFAVKNSNSSIINLQVLLLNEAGICINVIPLNSVIFDENNIYATTLTVQNTTKKVTVLANAIGYTYPAQLSFVGMTLSQIFLATTHSATVPPHYYQQPNMFYEGTAVIDNIIDGQDIQLTVGISRVVSKIVVQLSNNLKFTDNDGKGFKVVNSASTVYVNGIDSMFVVDTPAGVNLSLTEYLSDAIGFEYCQIYKATTFPLGSNGLYGDDILTFPQVNGTKLPFLIFSVIGLKGAQSIGFGNPLYYGMRIKNVMFSSGLSASLTSLPRNVVIIVTINNFVGVGSSTHPNPDSQDMLNLTVEVKSWNEYYTSGGTAQ
ncbi:MAG: hypothetical protein RSE02_08290 [Bacteroidales bacterium]